MGVVLDPRPEHARGDDWAHDEGMLRGWVDQNHLSNRLRDVLVRRDLHYLVDALNEIAAERRVDPRSVIGIEWQYLVTFHSSLASRWTLIELVRFRLQERQYRPQQHDRLDLLAHAVALPYCDVVVTERRVADLARKAGVAARFGTKVISRLAELPEAIERAIN